MRTHLPQLSTTLVLQLCKLALIKLAGTVLGLRMVLSHPRREELYVQHSTTSVKNAKSKVIISRPVSNAQTVVPGDIKAGGANGARKGTNCRLQKTRWQP